MSLVLSCSATQPKIAVQLQQVGFPIPSMGLKSEYKWTADLAAAVYTELEQLEVNGYGKAPGNLDSALRSFMAV